MTGFHAGPTFRVSASPSTCKGLHCGRLHHFTCYDDSEAILETLVIRKFSDKPLNCGVPCFGLRRVPDPIPVSEGLADLSQSAPLPLRQRRLRWRGSDGSDSRIGG